MYVMAWTGCSNGAFLYCYIIVVLLVNIEHILGALESKGKFVEVSQTEISTVCRLIRPAITEMLWQTTSARIMEEQGQ